MMHGQPNQSTTSLGPNADGRNAKEANIIRNIFQNFRWKRTLVIILFISFVLKWYTWASEGVKIHVATQKMIEVVQGNSVPAIPVDDTPKVAFLFLSTSLLHNEPIWRAFFEDAGRLTFLPRPPDNESLQPNSLPSLKRTKSTVSSREKANLSKDNHTLASNQTTRRVVKALNATLVHQHDAHWDCANEDSMIQAEVARLMSKDHKDFSVIQNQSLFSVYVNSGAYAEHTEGSIFKNSVIEDVVDTRNSYAQYTLVAAALQLLRVALQNPLNWKFVLLSESCIPIRPPEVIHAQLITEKRSRVRACPTKYRPFARWDWHIVDRQYWRKTPQFFALRRDHASIAVEDRDLQAKFKQYCYTSWEHGRICVSDEHFFGTLLAFHQRANETDCRGYVTSSEWNQGGRGWHPLTYNPSNVNKDLIKRLATKGLRLEECTAMETIASTGTIYKGFTKSGCLKRSFEKSNTTGKHWVVNHGFRPLFYPCPLFSRKFPKAAVENTLKAALSCDGAGLGYWCY